MQQATFVCDKNAAHHFTRFSDSIDKRLPCITCDGWMHPLPKAETTVPFQLWCFIGLWRPVCVKHRRIFMFNSHYYREHTQCEGDSYPDSDLAIRSGYRKVWLP